MCIVRTNHHETVSGINGHPTSDHATARCAAGCETHISQGAHGQALGSCDLVNVMIPSRVWKLRISFRKNMLPELLTNKLCSRLGCWNSFVDSTSLDRDPWWASTEQCNYLDLQSQLNSLYTDSGGTLLDRVSFVVWCVAVSSCNKKWTELWCGEPTSSVGHQV